MNQFAEPTDLELAALISSKICHDVIGPVGAIHNGLEILDEDDNADAKSYAMNVIRNVTEQASARLQFARFAFGAAGSAGAIIDLATAEQISRGFLGHGKHKLSWKGPARTHGERPCEAAAQHGCSGGQRPPPWRRDRARDYGLAQPAGLHIPMPRHRSAPAAASARVLERFRRAQPRCNDDPAVLHVSACPDSAMRIEIEQKGTDVVLRARPA